ncbi:MAG: hypothetical protein AAFW66_14725, partial [Pseudomonadota bacterium]
HRWVAFLTPALSALQLPEVKLCAYAHCVERRLRRRWRWRLLSLEPYRIRSLLRAKRVTRRRIV